MEELDVVKLTEDYKGISKGTEGTIVLKYDKKFFEVEFMDEDGDTIDIVMVPSEVLELVEHFEYDNI